LISRCALITLMYQNTQAAQMSNDDHAGIVNALAKGDATQAVALMDAHLRQVFDNLQLEKQVPAAESLEAGSSFAGL
jgi:DNA-binding GntR family transcriptional regulator